MNSISISVIIPCYNSASALAKNLPYLIDNLELTKKTFEIIIVDDGSNDEEKLKEIIKKNQLIYLANKQNFGKGEALRKGFNAAKGDIQIFTDPDIPYTFEAFRQIIQHLSSHEADLVIGNRLAHNSVYYHKIGLIRRWGSRFMSFFLGTLVTSGYYDTQCGIKGFTKQAAEKIFDWTSIKRFAIDTEIIYLALKFRYSIKKIPVQLRSSDGNTVKVLSDGIRFIKDLYHIKFHYEKRKKSKNEIRT
jgi:dolichyl-phosphate beta-glucosyltransferase